MSRTRFVYFCVEKIDGRAIEALTLIALLGQGVADIIVFGESYLLPARLSGSC